MTAAHCTLQDGISAPGILHFTQYGTIGYGYPYLPVNTCETVPNLSLPMSALWVN
jgi:hypothetical protein